MEKKFQGSCFEKWCSEITFEKVMKDVRFLPKVIEYDRFQPEFYEDTKTYISKRTAKKELKMNRFL